MLRAEVPSAPLRWLDGARGTAWGSPLFAAALTAAAFALIAIAGGTIAVALIVGVAIVVATLAEPRIGLYLVVLTVPVQQYGSIGGLTATQAAFALVLGAWAVGKALRGARWDVLRDRTFWCFLVFYLAILASIRVADDVRLALAEAFRWGEALAIYAIARDTLRTRRDWAWLVGIFLVGAAGESFIGSIQSALGLGNRSFVVGNLSRAFGSFGRPNSYAGYLEMVFPLALAVACWAILTLPRAIMEWFARRDAPLAVERRAAARVGGLLLALGGAGATALMLAAAITLSLSRGAWLGLAAGLLVMALLTGRRVAIATLAILALLAVVLALGGTGVLPKTLEDRLDSAGSSLVLTDYDTTPITPENFAVKERMAYWFGGLAMFRDHPWQGVGLGNYGPQYDARYFTSPFMISQVHAHNYYIHIAAETGVIGLAGYLLLIGGVLATGIRAVRRSARDPFARALALGGVGIVVAVAVHNLFEDLHVLSLGVHLSALWAMLAAIAATGTRRQATQPISDRAGAAGAAALASTG